MVTRVRLSYDKTPPPGTWEQTPSPDQLVTPYEHTWLRNTAVTHWT
jgi:hypothetical protein